MCTFGSATHGIRLTEKCSNVIIATSFRLIEEGRRFAVERSAVVSVGSVVRCGRCVGGRAVVASAAAAARRRRCLCRRAAVVVCSSQQRLKSIDGTVLNAWLASSDMYNQQRLLVIRFRHGWL